MLKKLELEEIRSYCQCPAKYHMGDLLGVGLAAFFGLDGLRRIGQPGEAFWAVTSITLAGWMAWIHAKRFQYGSELGSRWEAR